MRKSKINGKATEEADCTVRRKPDINILRENISSMKEE